MSPVIRRNDPAALRVLWMLDRVQSELLELELSARLARVEDRIDYATATAEQLREHTDRGYQALGHCDGLAAAGELLRSARREYAHRHGVAGGTLIVTAGEIAGGESDDQPAAPANP